MKHIITHPGVAHRDEVVACSLLLAEHPEMDAIYRREPMQSDLSDPEIAVVDIGGRFEPALHNYDHHQMPTSQSLCAVSLVWYDLLKEARFTWPWLRPLEVLDSQGPRGLIELLRLQSFPRQVIPLFSPFDGIVLAHFAKHTVIHKNDGWLFPMLQETGRVLWDGLRQADSIRANINELVSFITVKGLSVAVAQMVCETQPINHLENYLLRHHPDTAIVVSIDSRGSGWSLFRRPCAENYVDFRKLAGYHGIQFVHKGGFVAKTDLPYSMDQVTTMLEIAITPRAVPVS